MYQNTNDGELTTMIYLLDLKKLQKIISPIIKYDNVIGICDCLFKSNESKIRKKRRELLNSIPKRINFSIVNIQTLMCGYTEPTDIVHNYYIEEPYETIGTFMKIKYPSSYSLIGLSKAQYDILQKLFINKIK